MSDREPTLGTNGELWWWDDDAGRAIRWWDDPTVRETLLRRDIDAGFHPALVELANELHFEYQGRRDNEGNALLRQAVALGVPEAYETLAAALEDEGYTDQAEALLRQGIAAGGRRAATSLAAMLHERGDDQQAFLVLQQAAMSGDAYAHWILLHSRKQLGTEFETIDNAFYHSYGGYYSAPCGLPWTLNLGPAGLESP